MKILKKIGKIALICLCCLIALFLVVFGGLNALKFAIYGEYYGIREKICVNPGLSDGFICQGLCVLEKDDTFNTTLEDKFLVSGYMGNKSASRIYVTDLDNQSYFVTIKNADDSDFKGHAGGIAVNNDTVYVADGSAIHIIPLQTLLTAKNGDSVKIVDKIPVNNSASFIYADSNYLYVGEFHNGKQYITNHPFDTPEGKNYAIVSRYSYSNLYSPDRIYSIGNKVQGFCYTPDGKIVLATSYGIADSVYYVYDDAKSTNSGLTLDGAPVYFLGECERDISGPAMAEGLDYYNGKIINVTESASNKYIFGKFFFANKIIGLDINK